jgi:biotin carboxyl carrier protein
VSVDVTVNGRQWKVALDSAEQPGRFTVTIKGKRRSVDASFIDAETLSLIDGGRTYEIRLHTRGHTGDVGIEVGGVLYEASIAKAAKRERLQLSGAAAGKTVPDPVSIKTPMPGRVVRLLAAVGDRVAARQGLVVVEAMKMENELRSPTDGVVKEILVGPGAAVEAGAVLVVVDP